MMLRTVSSFPLAPSVKVKLISAGFHTAADLTDVQTLQLCRATGLSQDEANEVLRTLRYDSSPLQQGAAERSMTALDLLHQEETQGRIITFCSELDAVLGGGVAVGKTTEICGVPGIGKTQLCVQLAVDVQIPVCFGGLGAEAVFIDTEGGFVVERLVGVARAAVEHCAALAEDEEQRNAIESFTVEKILSGVFLIRCHDHVDLLAEIHLLPDFLSKHPQVRLVVIDSVAFPFRLQLEDLSQRTRLLSSFSLQLTGLSAAQNGPAVVWTSQMTTKVQGVESRLVPALGEIWGHAATQRLILHWEEDQRFATLYKSSSRRDATVCYQLTAEGFRDVDVGASPVPASHSPTAGSHSKRPCTEQQHH